MLLAIQAVDYEVCSVLEHQFIPYIGATGFADILSLLFIALVVLVQYESNKPNTIRPFPLGTYFGWFCLLFFVYFLGVSMAAARVCRMVLPQG